MAKPVKHSKNPFANLPMWRCQSCHYVFAKSENQLLKCPRCGGDRIPYRPDRQQSRPKELSIPEFENKRQALQFFAKRAGINYLPHIEATDEELGEFAHHVIEPNLPSRWKKAFYEHFTEIFAHGFEGGDFGEDPETGYSFTGTNYNLMTGDVTSGDAYAGTYKAVISGIDGDGDYGKIYYNHAARSTIFMRCYLRVVTNVFNGAGTINIGPGFFVQASPPGQGIALTIWNPATSKWGARHYVGGGYTEYWETGTSTFSADTWYCVELGVVIDDDFGELNLRVNDVQKINQTELDTNDRGNVGSSMLFVYPLQAESSTRTMWFDCVVVADAYIGPEGATYTKTWQADVLFNKLGVTKSLSVDAALQKQDVPKTYALDSLFQKLDVLEQFGADVNFLKRNIIRSFGVDARFGALVTQEISRQIDALFKKLGITKTLAADTLIQKKDATIQKQVDMLLKALGVTKSLGADALFLRACEQMFGVDVVFGSESMVFVIGSRDFSQINVSSRGFRQINIVSEPFKQINISSRDLEVNA